MVRYDLFKQLGELIKMSKMKDKYGYEKMIQTGDISYYDYDIGFHDLSIFYDGPSNNKHYVRIWFGTIDDGDFGAWKEVESEEKAKTLIDNVAKEVFKDMLAFPTDDELNELLRPYGLYVCYE